MFLSTMHSLQLFIELTISFQLENRSKIITLHIVYQYVHKETKVYLNIGRNEKEMKILIQKGLQYYSHTILPTTFMISPIDGLCKGSSSTQALARTARHKASARG